MCWLFLPHVRFFILLTVFELLPKTCNFTICSIFSNSGHVGWCTASPDTILKLDTLVMIQTKFGFHWSCTFRGEDFWKGLRRTTDDNDGRQVMAIADLTLWVRWAKKYQQLYCTQRWYGHPGAFWQCCGNSNKQHTTVPWADLIDDDDCFKTHSTSDFT